MLLLMVGLSLLPIPSASSAADQTASAYERDAVAATNKARALAGRSQLKQDDCLQRFADRQAEKMLRDGQISHQELRGVMRKCRLSSAGENVAYGFASGVSVVDDGWMQSPSHRVNLLYGRFRLIAVGAVRDTNGAWYAAQVFGSRR